MSAPAVDRPLVGAPDEGEQRPAGRGLATLLTVVGVVALVAGLALVATTFVGEPARVPVSFGGDANAIESDWGNEEHFGVPGSWIVVYDHGREMVLELPWTGDDVVTARLGDESEHLLQVTGVEQREDTLAVAFTMGNCRYFNERELDLYTGLTVTAPDGDTDEVLFDKPLLVHSPMLNGCPDRTIDRGDDVRGETYRR